MVKYVYELSKGTKHYFINFITKNVLFSEERSLYYTY